MNRSKKQKLALRSCVPAFKIVHGFIPYINVIFIK